MTNRRGLYIHIPFCSHICSYCDFTKMFYNDEICSKYLDKLEDELHSYKINDIKSIYIGGGTPSSLSEKNLEKLLKIVNEYYFEGISYAFEANVESLTDKKISLLKKYHVNRVSLGVQSFNQKLLYEMNRFHDENKVREVINNLITNGITNINVDLIYGLPNQTFEMLKEDVSKILTLPITHISTYSLMVNPNTLFYINKVKEKDDDLLREEYDYICNELKKKKIYRYEVSNFSLKGYESIHNKIYWKNEEYYGCGLGASGYLNKTRYDNTKSLNKYMDGAFIANKEEVNAKDEEFYYLMLGLRLDEGINLKDFNEKFNVDFKDKYKDKIEILLHEDLIDITDETLKVKENNLYILDYILEKLLF